MDEKYTHMSETIFPFLRAQYAQRKFDVFFSVIDVRAVYMCIDSYKHIFYNNPRRNEHTCRFRNNKACNK